MKSNIESLLNEVSELNRKHEDEAKKTGEKFNIFSILGVESRETSTHSAFLVELLNPKGSHGRGGLFLRLFLETLKEKISEEKFPVIDWETANVEKEQHLGTINAEYTEGGRADIVITSSGRTICIENKIYADDQENQLIRYSKKYGETGLVLYLTLNGGSATEVSTIDTSLGIELIDGQDYFSISYSEFILDWLKICQESVREINPLREAIGQYINLVKKLTHMNLKEDERTELIEKITGNREDFDAAMDIHHLHYQIIGSLFNKMTDRVCGDDYYPEQNIKVERGVAAYGSTGEALELQKPEWPFKVVFYLEKKNGSELSLAIPKPDNSNDTEKLRSQINEKLSKCAVGVLKVSEIWLWDSYLEDWENIDWFNLPTEGADMIRDVMARIVGPLDECK